MEWLHADDNVATIHHYTDSENVHMVVSLDENEEGVRKLTSIDKLIKN